MAEGYAIVVLVTRTYGPVLPDLRNSIKMLGFLCLLFIYFFILVLFYYSHGWLGGAENVAPRGRDLTVGPPGQTSIF